MTVPYLPDDCIYCILKYLQNYRSTLFNCLLVNRFWCNAAVPLLYTNPFDALTRNKNYCSIILTLILCFNKTGILRLKNQYIHIIDIDIDIEYKPLFEYPKYIENYNYSITNGIISGWLRTYSNLSYQHLSGISREIHQSILYQCNNIKQLNISLSLFYNSNFHFIRTFTSNLSKLNSLTLDLRNFDAINEIGLEFLNNIGNVCLSLRELEITSYNYDTFVNTVAKEKLFAIIQKQGDLKVCKISFCERLLNDTFVSLELQKHSLVFIEFKHLDFSSISFKEFTNLSNLKYLSFDNCRGISSLQCEVLEFSSFKLKELNFQYNSWNDDASSLIIKHLGASLQRLAIDNLTIPIIENILTHCLNLITLTIIPIAIVNLSVFSYFNNLKIRILNIISFSYHDDDMDEVFVNLANNLPVSVNEISINNLGCNFKTSYLKKFLENCHNCLEIINVRQFIELEFLQFLQLILNYIERNDDSLKVLGIMELKELKEELNEEELKLLDQIMAKGVKIVDFHSICKEYSYDL